MIYPLCTCFLVMSTPLWVPEPFVSVCATPMYLPPLIGSVFFWRRDRHSVLTTYQCDRISFILSTLAVCLQLQIFFSWCSSAWETLPFSYHFSFFQFKYSLSHWSKLSFHRLSQAGSHLPQQQIHKHFVTIWVTSIFFAILETIWRQVLFPKESLLGST